jgi:hypothetical protein
MSITKFAVDQLPEIPTHWSVSKVAMTLTEEELCATYFYLELLRKREMKPHAEAKRLGIYSYPEAIQRGISPLDYNLEEDILAVQGKISYALLLQRRVLSGRNSSAGNLLITPMTGSVCVRVA